MTHEAFALQIETRLGSGEGKDAKGPDMKVWGKGKRLEKVCFRFTNITDRFLLACSRSTGNPWNSVTHLLSCPSRPSRAMTFDTLSSRLKIILRTRAFSSWHLV